jgi:hypothetical protein|tara:strand:- start:432 stop:704 length:273 start_codon:yes stop_codon:yes gene_type:complete
MTMPNQVVEYRSHEMKLNGEVFARKVDGKWVLDSLVSEALTKSQRKVLERNFESLATNSFRVCQALLGCVLGEGGSFPKDPSEKNFTSEN